MEATAKHTSKRTYLLYDERAADGNTDSASVLVACDSDSEAKSYRGRFGGMSCYSYAADETEHDERFEWNWFPKGGAQ